MKRLLALLLAALLVCSLAACGAEREERNRESAEDALEDSLEALTEGGEVWILGPGGSPVAMQQAQGLGGLIAGRLDMDVESVKERGKSATAELTITAPDAAPLVKEALEGMTAFDEVAFTEKLTQLLENAEETVFVVEVELELVDGAWCIVPNGDFSNAISGGLLEQYMALRQTVMDALVEGGDGE